MYAVQCKLYNVQCVLYSVHFILLLCIIIINRIISLYILLYIVVHIYCTVYSVQCIVYGVQCNLTIYIFYDMILVISSIHKSSMECNVLMVSEQWLPWLRFFRLCNKKWIILKKDIHIYKYISPILNNIY